jgi:hypothetical protein
MPYLCYNNQKDNRGYNCKKYIVIAAIQERSIGNENEFGRTQE